MSNEYKKAQAEPVAPLSAYALLDDWADASCTRFVSRSGGIRTTDTVSRDDLAQLINAARATNPAAQPQPVNAQMRALLTDWVTSFVDSIEGGEADELVQATRAVLADAEVQAQKPLTDGQIGDIFHAARNAKLDSSRDNSRHRLSVIEIARAIERAHGIGEGGAL